MAIFMIEAERAYVTREVLCLAVTAKSAEEAVKRFVNTLDDKERFWCEVDGGPDATSYKFKALDALRKQVLFEKDGLN